MHKLLRIMRKGWVVDASCFPDKEEFCSADDRDLCDTCGGDGYGVEGEDWPMEDPVNGPWDADEDGISPCPNCRGSGNAADMRYW